MKRLRAFGLFWYEFVIGDDWRVAVWIALSLAATAGLVSLGVNAWWLPPIAVATALGLSLRRAVRTARRR
ncbi:hypothetical protein ACFO3J_12385 [Streptomyces polygonati]|uniref:Uncharacterized protein n=1 Tax=Streptomyces polygonati TaxID=1617087 RepID=A0ABV8HMK2_9ACTN